MQPRNHAAIASIVNEVSSKARRFGMTIQDFSVITPTLASVVAAVSEVDEDQINDQLLNDTDGAVTVVPKSVRPVVNTKQTVARFFVTANTKVQDFTAEVKQRMVPINANVYADEETNSIWHLNGEGEDQYLVQQSSDNLEEIFNARKQRRQQSGQGDGTVAYATGDFAAFATNAGKVQTGLLYEDDRGLQVFDYERRTHSKLDPKQIICSADITEDEEELDLEELRANMSTKQGSEILNYYRKLYGSNPAFFNKLSQLVRNHDGKVQLNDTNPDVNEMLQRVVRH